MRFTLARSNSPDRVQKFLERNGLRGRASLVHCGGRSFVVVDIKDSALAPWQKEIVVRHFSFYDIVDWSEEGTENILLWEMPHRWSDVVRELLAFFPEQEYDSIATAEARGFIVGGAVSALLKKPLICIRKHKPLYDSLPGYKVEYTNWKGDPEAIYIFHREHHRGRRCLFVNDVFQHGNCLEACLKLLEKEGVTVWWVPSTFAMQRNREPANVSIFP